MKNVVLLVLAVAAGIIVLTLSLLRDDEATDVPDRDATVERRNEVAAAPKIEMATASDSRVAVSDTTSEPATESQAMPSLPEPHQDPSAGPDILSELRGSGVTASSSNERWREVSKLGIADDLIKELELLLAKNPDDSRLQEMLGNALIAKLRSEEVLSDAERKDVKGAAMDAFDTALDLDPQNQVARFSRAMVNSFGPAVLGGQRKAINDFETLLSQQRQSPLTEDQSHSMFFLSNLYSGSGQADQAAALLAEARSLFPDDSRFQ